MKGSNNQAPQGPTCLRWECTMILCLSTAMVMMVREDMKTAMQGKVLTSLERYNIYCEFMSYYTSFTLNLTLQKKSLLFIWDLSLTASGADAF